MLLPSIYGLDADGLLPDDFRIVATARNELTDTCYRNLFVESLKRYVQAQELTSDRIGNLLERVRFIQADAHDRSQFDALANIVRPSGGRHVIFLSTAPSLFEPTILGLAASGPRG